MPRVVRCSLIQATNVSPAKAMVEKHLDYIRQAADAGAQIVCLQEIFNGPYFCAEQETRWYDVAEPIPDGPIIRLMREEARQRHVALIVPVYEREQEDRKSTRLNSSHLVISYAAFCLKKKKP